MITDRQLLDKAGKENGEYYCDDYIKTTWFASYKFRYAVIEFGNQVLKALRGLY